MSSQEYAMSRVRDALRSAEGNHKKAEKAILKMLEKDETLLLGLAGPHLEAIISHAVSYASRKMEDEKPQEIDINKVETGEVGDAILRTSLADSLSGGQSFGKDLGRASKPGKTSQGHIDAIHQLAGGRSKSKE